ncbi:MAG: hypothetical protein MUF16_01695, partial [Burkholderiaceae bacterium]|nr:hypothetical protein [Burkholderiaceae bacterium]
MLSNMRRFLVDRCARTKEGEEMEATAIPASHARRDAQVKVGRNGMFQTVVCGLWVSHAVGYAYNSVGLLSNFASRLVAFVKMRPSEVWVRPRFARSHPTLLNAPSEPQSAVSTRQEHRASWTGFTPRFTVTCTYSDHRDNLQGFRKRQFGPLHELIVVNEFLGSQRCPWRS